MSGSLVTNKTAVSGFAPKREDLISSRQLAAELGMCLRTLMRHHEKRTGPPRITLNRHYFYRRAAVDEWLARNEGYGVVQAANKHKPNRKSQRSPKAAARSKAA